MKEGSFVETGGDPALMVVGSVQSVSDAQKIIIPEGKQKAINEYDILLGFLARRNVESPYEYIAQICALPASTLPVYYYMSKAGMSADDTVSRLRQLPRSTQSQKYLISRIENGKSTKGGQGQVGTKIYERRKRYLDSIHRKEAKAPDGVDAAKSYLEALQALEKSFIAPSVSMF